MTTIWRTYEAQAAHHLPHVRDGHKCKTVHGHNFKVTVFVSREVLEEGMVIDFEELDSIWHQYIRERFDHKLVNDWIPNPTSELIAEFVHAVYCKELPRHFGVAVEVQENERSGARYP